MKKYKVSFGYKYVLLLSFLAFLFFVPLTTKAWYDSSYIYRSTVTGSGINDTGNYVYKIVNQKSNFSSEESVYVLTRIFNITHLDKFQFKFQLLTRQGSSRIELYSPLYQPNGNWWAETYAWHNFGKLDADTYEIKTYISVNGNAYKYLDRKLITVEGVYNNYSYNNYNYNHNYNNSYNYQQYQPVNYYYHTPSYEYNWTYTGTDVEGYANNKYKILNRQTKFNKNDEVHVLTKLSKISGIGQFKIKHELYLYGNSWYSSNESNTFWPNNNDWDYNYSWYNFGKLPNGEHVVKVYIKIGNENYKQISAVTIKVGKEDNNYQYKYGWTRSDTSVRYLGDYKYETYKNRTIFHTDESLKVLTKLSDIVGADTFQIRHELRYLDNTLYKRLDSKVQRPNYRRWDYNFVENDFGRLPVGEYKLITYVKINNRFYKNVNTKNLSIKKRVISTTRVDSCNQHNTRCYSNCTYNKPSYNYSWTRIGSQTYPQSRRTAYNYY